MVTNIHKEIDDNLDYKDINCNQISKKGKSFYKPWWNNTCQMLWNKAAATEKTFLKYRGSNRIKQKLRINVKIERDRFDKYYRKSKRLSYKDKQIEIANLNSHDPKKFWEEEVDKLGPNKKDVIPMEI